MHKSKQTQKLQNIQKLFFSHQSFEAFPLVNFVKLFIHRENFFLLVTHLRLSQRIDDPVAG